MNGKDLKSVKDTHGLPFKPLRVWAPAPYRRPIEQVPGGRRPVVAILDTGVAAHKWFTPAADDPILIDAGKALGWRGTITHPDLSSSWHGTFVAGLIRQNAPDARILSLALERTPAGGIASGQLLAGLTWLLERPERFADVICLAVGFTVRCENDEHYASDLAVTIRKLHDRGTVVVAAAGNITNDSAGPVYPAALADPTLGKLPSLVAVGAIDAAGTLAEFSVQGDWVTRSYVGVEVFSATPVADESAANAIDEADHFACDVHPNYMPDGNESGAVFGRGSGTSYSAAGFAGRVAQTMLDDPDGVRDVSAEAATQRAQRTLDAVGFLT